MATPFRNSASCTHISQFCMHMWSIAAKNSNMSVLDSTCGNDEPTTSYPCQWKVPKKRKESTTPIASAVFVKHDCIKQEKRKVSSTEDFDPRPTKYRGTAPSLLPTLLKDVYGESLGVTHFGEILSRKVNTAPDKLVLRILNQ